MQGGETLCHTVAASSASTVWQANTTIEFVTTLGRGKGSVAGGGGAWQLLKHLICWNLARHVSLLTATVYVCVYDWESLCECVCA